MASKTSADTKAMQNDQAVLLECVRGLFNQPRHSDLSLFSGNRVWYVHKTILCARSAYFRVVCNGRFKESLEGRITLQEDHPAAVEAMLRFLYSGDFNDELDDVNTPPILFDVFVHDAVDKYSVTRLAELARLKFADRLKAKGWATRGFAEAVTKLWADPADNQKELRDLALKCMVENARYIADEGMEALYEPLQEAIASSPGLGLELYMSLAKPLNRTVGPRPSLYECADCKALVVLQQPLSPKCARCNMKAPRKTRKW